MTSRKSGRALRNCAVLLPTGGSIAETQTGCAPDMNARGSSGGKCWQRGLAQHLRETGRYAMTRSRAEFETP